MKPVGVRLALEATGRFKPVGDHLLAYAARAYVWAE